MEFLEFMGFIAFWKTTSTVRKSSPWLVACGKPKRHGATRWRQHNDGFWGHVPLTESDRYMSPHSLGRRYERSRLTNVVRKRVARWGLTLILAASPVPHAAKNRGLTPTR